MLGYFRSAGDIIFSHHEPMPGQYSNVQLKIFSETSNFLQCQQPLTPRYPCFFASIKNLSPKSQISIGIAGPDIAEDARPGHWNNTVGYSGQTGRCTTSHNHKANTFGEKIEIGDVFCVFVTHFGKQMSTVVFLKNERPVATRYHFETDHNKFLPTITLENGPIDLAIMWPEAVIEKPKFSDKEIHKWIQGPNTRYDPSLKMFMDPTSDVTSDASLLQCPVPLRKEFNHFEVIVHQTSDTLIGPAVGIATCSPLKPMPTCELLRDYFRWMPDGENNKAKVGQRIGIGIHYDPEVRHKTDFNERDQQLVLCFVTFETAVVVTYLMLQPEGGFFPIVVLKTTKKLAVDVESNRKIDGHNTLDKIFQKSLQEARTKLENDCLNRTLQMDMFVKSKAFQCEFCKQLLEPDLSKQSFKLKLPSSETGIHVIQFKSALSESHPYFCIEVRKLNEDSVVTIGITDPSFPKNKHPGKINASTGYSSRDGRMYYNTKYHGNLLGERYEEGDTVGVELSNFYSNSPVALFSKNNKPIGTRYVTIHNRDHLLPTVAVSGNGYDVELHIYWQNQYCRGPDFEIKDLDSWCVPQNAELDHTERVIYVKEHTSETCFIQSPYPLNSDKKFDFFEITLIDRFGDEYGVPPPGIALASACVQDIPEQSKSNFRQDFLRFLADGEAQNSVKYGQSIGFGIIIPDSEKNKSFDRLLICYLTCDRNILLTRVMYEPPGGFYPVLVLLEGTNRVKLSSVMHIVSHPLSAEICEQLVSEARTLIAEEERLLADGKKLDDLPVGQNDLIRTYEDLEKLKIPDSPRKMANVALTAHLLDKKRKSLKSTSEDSVTSKTCVLL